MATTFKAIRDGDDWLVADASVGAMSFAMIPAREASMFDRREQAEAQAKRLTGKAVELRMIETPDRFEAVADTMYGPAWE